VTARALAVAVLIVAGAGSSPAPAQAAPGAIVRVSIATSGAQANAPSSSVAVTPNGRFVLFDSTASNLVPGDTNGRADVFVRNRRTGRTSRVSVGVDGRQANGASFGESITPDGRFVVFISAATNLTRQADRNGEPDVFVRDRALATTSRVSVRPGGGQFHDGSFGGLSGGQISANGRWVAFGEYVPLRPTGCCAGERTFVHDRRTGATRRIDTGLAFVLPAAISANGQYVAATRQDVDQNSIAIVLRNRVTGRSTQVLLPNLGPLAGLVMTPDAHYMAFAVLNAAASGWDVLRWNRVTGRFATVIGNDTSTNVQGGISADGRYVTFCSDDPGIVAGDTNAHTDVFRRDLDLATTIRVDLTAGGGQIPAGACGGLLSGDGGLVVFDTPDAGVVAGDTNHVTDVFTRAPIA
jgi:Tol biopolymer transport system component